MKIVIAGATGVLGTELVSQALSHPAITAVIALGRREMPKLLDLKPTDDFKKLKSGVLQDFENYTDAEKAELPGTDAVIWTIALVPSKQRTATWEEDCKISREYALRGIESISQLPRKGKTIRFRFTYRSGENSQRDPTKKPWLLGDHALMRGDAETRVLAYAQQSHSTVESCVAKPGLINEPDMGILTRFGKLAVRTIVNLSNIHLHVISAALLDQSINGFEKKTLENKDMVRIGDRALAELDAIRSRESGREGME